jgi:hypothetical protein
VRKDELAAVCVPWGFTNAGPSLDTFSIVESPLMPFSITMKEERKGRSEGVREWCEGRMGEGGD